MTACLATTLLVALSPESLGVAIGVPAFGAGVLLIGTAAAADAANEIQVQTREERVERARKLLLEDNEPSAALEFLEQVLADDPGYGPALYYAGVALGRLGRFDEAYDLLVGAAESDPGNAEAHRMACIAAFQGGDFPRAWDQAILAEQAGMDMSGVFSQLTTAADPPADLESRLAAPRVFVADVDLSRLATADLRPGEYESIWTATSQARAEILEARRQFRLGLLRSDAFAVVRQEELATHALLIEADKFDGAAMDGYLRLVDVATGEETYRRALSLSNIGSVGTLSGEVRHHVGVLETWLERDERGSVEMVARGD